MCSLRCKVTQYARLVLNSLKEVVLTARCSMFWHCASMLTSSTHFLAPSEALITVNMHPMQGTFCTTEMIFSICALYLSKNLQMRFTRSDRLLLVTIAQKSQNLMLLSSILCRFFAAMQYFYISEEKVSKQSRSFSLSEGARDSEERRTLKRYSQFWTVHCIFVRSQSSCAKKSSLRVTVCCQQKRRSFYSYSFRSASCLASLMCSISSRVFEYRETSVFSLTSSTICAISDASLRLAMQTELQRYTSSAVSSCWSFSIALASARSCRARENRPLSCSSLLRFTQYCLEGSSRMSLLQSERASSYLPSTTQASLLSRMKAWLRGSISICSLIHPILSPFIRHS